MKCDCANCPTHACYTRGVNCTGVPLEAVKEAYTEEELKLMQAAAYVEGTFYSNICRLQETAEFAKAMGYKKLGMSFCIGLNAEARYIAKYFKQQGFEFYSVCCKNCSFPKKELGLKQVSKETSRTFFQLTDWKGKEAFLNMTARKTYEPEITMMDRKRNAGTGLGI